MKIITKCRICGNENLMPIISLGEQALTGVFPRSKSEKITSGPLELVRCSGTYVCELVQLKQSYSSEEMYGNNYGYRSGLNKSMVDHLKSKVAAIQNYINLKNGDLVIDIGSNDGTTLLAYPQDKYDLLGIDPTGEKFKDYYPTTIKLISNYFSSEAVLKLTKKKAKIITSFSMFYDLEDPVGFAEDIAETLDESGIWVFEQSYLPSMIRTNSFDTICHEHLEFYGLKQIQWICKKAKLKINKIEFNEVNGGSFSVTASKQNSKFLECIDNISRIMKEEEDFGMGNGEAFESFIKNIEDLKEKLIKFLIEAKKNKILVGGLGASTKGNVLLQYFGITSELIFGIGEVNKDKYGRYTPGTNIPLMPEDEMLKMNPQYILVLPWHFKEFFINSEKFKGRKLIFPLPKFEIIDA